jgi:hypothetical protein
MVATVGSCRNRASSSRRILIEGAKLQKKDKNRGAAANFSLFTFHFSLFFITFAVAIQKLPDL